MLYRCTWQWRSYVLPVYLVVEVSCYTGVLGSGDLVLYGCTYQWRSRVMQVYLLMEVPCLRVYRYLEVEVLCYTGVLCSGGPMLYRCSWQHVTSLDGPLDEASNTKAHVSAGVRLLTITKGLYRLNCVTHQPSVVYLHSQVCLIVI